MLLKVECNVVQSEIFGQYILPMGPKPNLIFCSNGSPQDFDSNSFFDEGMFMSTDYGHMKAKPLIICSPNSNPNPK